MKWITFLEEKADYSGEDIERIRKAFPPLEFNQRNERRSKMKKKKCKHDWCILRAETPASRYKEMEREVFYMLLEKKPAPVYSNKPIPKVNKHGGLELKICLNCREIVDDIQSYSDFILRVIYSEEKRLEKGWELYDEVKDG